MRALVVDDDTYIRIMLAIELPGLDLIEASRAGDAFDLFRREPPEVVVVDRRLPDGDGLDLVRRIRTELGDVETPVLVITAAFEPEDTTEMMLAGVDVYLGKPVDPNLLADCIGGLYELEPEERASRREWVVARLAAGQRAQSTDGIPLVDTSEPEAPGRSGWPWRRRP